MCFAAPAVLGSNRETLFGNFAKGMINKPGEEYHWRVSAAFSLMNDGVFFGNQVPPFAVPAIGISVLHKFSLPNRKPNG